MPHPAFIAEWRDPSEVMDRKHLQATLDQAMRALPEKQRLVFVLRDIEGLSVREAARLLAISEGNVKVRLLRARLALREKLTRVFGARAAAFFLRIRTRDAAQPQPRPCCEITSAAER